MGSLVDDKTLNSLNNQISGGSRSSILLSHVDFNTVEDDDDMMSAKCLQTKYNVLTNDNKISLNSPNKDFVMKFNGQTKCQLNAAINNIVNGNSGENADGIPVSKHVIFPPERVLLELKECRPIGAGLVNMGNTCFLNSVLQCLTYCPPLVNYLLHSNDHNTNKCNINANLFCTVCEMTRHIRQARNHCGEAIKPLGICRRLKSIAKHFQFGRQEDAHEFLRYLIDHMWKSCLANSDLTHQKLDPLSKETTAINQIFGGYHRSQVLCIQCKAKSNTYDYFMDFMLDIKNVNSLEKALDKFVAPELLQHDDSYKCTRCKRKVLAKKQFTVFKAPNVATFQFKRFDYNRMFGGKITKQISYPEKLDLRPYMSDNKGPPIHYKLNSVLVHLGPTCNSGHYFCYVRNSNNSWYLMDDSRVIQSNLQHALNQGQAYVLFYVRVDTDFHKPTPIKNFISQSTPNGIKLSNISSPELMARNQKLNSFNSPTKIPVNASQPLVKRFNSKDLLKPNESEATKQIEKNDRKPNPLETNGRQTKGLVPYTSDDSSDEDSPKQTNHNHNHMNGSLNSNCDKSHNYDTISTNENNSNQSETNLQKEIKTENILPKVKLNSNQNIPSPKMKINSQQNVTNHTSDPTSCLSVAPEGRITLKVKATSSSWQVVDTASLRSPSVASNSSTNSINSTTEWTVSDCKPDCNGKHKHKHKNKRCLNTANGNVTQLMSTNDKIPQKDEQKSQLNDESNRRLNDISAQKVLKPELQNQTLHTSFKVSVAANHDRETEPPLQHRQSHQKAEHSDAKSISSHRSSSDSQSERRRSNDRERSHSKSTNSDDEKTSFGGHKYEKKRKRDSIEDIKDSESKVQKIKHKKKKKKNKKHKKRDRSVSESEESDDGLQWVERTKETVERERDSESNKTYVKQWDENVRDLAKKRSLDEPIESDGHKHHINSGNTNENNDNIVSELVKNNIRNFGEKVNAWNGGPSHIDRCLNEDKHRIDSDDEYDEDYDKGKTKKIKIRDHRNEKFMDSAHNPFQKLQSFKYNNKLNGNSDSHPMKNNFVRHFKDRNHKPWKKSYDNRHERERRH